MADISKLSDEELLRLYQAQKGVSQPQSAPSTDLSKLSDEQLVALAKAKSGSAPTSQRGTFLDPLIGQGVFAGWGDELKAGARAGARKILPPSEPESFGELYSQEHARANADLTGFRERRPVTSAGLELAGAGLGVLGTGGATIVPRIAPPAVRAGMMAVEGAGYGGLYGAGSAEPGQRGQGAAVGAATGAVTGGLVGSVAGRMQSKASGRAVPTTASLEQIGQDLYQKADQVGLVVAQPTWNKIVQNIALLAKQERINKTLHTKPAAALAELLKSRGEKPTLMEIDTLRKVLKIGEGSADKEEARMAGLLVDALDTQIERLNPADVLSGDPKAANILIKEARSVWTKKSKGEIVDDIMANAEISAGQYSQSGKENAIRAGFAALAKNKNRMRRFTTEEQAAIRKTAMGGPVDRTLRLIGKAAIRGPVSAIPSMAAMAVDPTGMLSMGVAGVGEVANRAATNQRIINAEQAGQLMRSGGRIPAAALTDQQRRALAASMGTTLPVAPGFEEMFR